MGGSPATLGGPADSGGMSLHPLVDDVVRTYLALVDAETDGLVEGQYLEGSAALGDFCPHTSDIDFVAVTATPPDKEALAALHRVHTRLRERWRRPFFDGTYLTWEDLAGGPAVAAGRPSSHEGQLRVTREHRPSPVTWHTLAHHGVTCRGPATADLDIWTDPETLAASQNANLDEYWRRLLDRASHLPSKFGLFALTAYAAVWTVTGVSRLHYTLSTGDITSKAGAGHHALQTFPDRWHRLVNESLRIRRGDAGRSLYRSPLARRRDVLAFGEMVIADAHRLYTDHWQPTTRPEPED